MGDVKLSRLRLGEALSGIAGLALLVFLFALPWLAGGSGHTTRTGWEGLPVLRWLIVICALVALALAIAQATRASPAIPVTLSVFVTVFGVLTSLLVLIRLLTTGDDLRAGAFLGLLSALGVGLGGFLSLRREGGWTPGPDHPVKTVRLESAPPS